MRESVPVGPGEGGPRESDLWVKVRVRVRVRVRGRVPTSRARGLWGVRCGHGCHLRNLLRLRLRLARSGSLGSLARSGSGSGSARARARLVSACGTPLLRSALRARRDASLRDTWGSGRPDRRPRTWVRVRVRVR